MRLTVVNKEMLLLYLMIQSLLVPKLLFGNEKSAETLFRQHRRVQF